MKRAITACALALALEGIAGCGSSNSQPPHIVTLDSSDDAAGLAFSDTRPGVPYTVGDLIICLDRPGRVAIDRIEQVEPFGDISLDAFNVIPNAMEKGDEGFSDENRNRSLADQGLEAKDAVVMDKECPDLTKSSPSPAVTPKSVALLLQYSKRTDQTAGNHGIKIFYSSDGAKAETTMKWEIVLCAADDTTTENC